MRELRGRPTDRYFHSCFSTKGLFKVSRSHTLPIHKDMRTMQIGFVYALPYDRQIFDVGKKLLK